MTKHQGSPTAASEATLKVANSVEQFDESTSIRPSDPEFGHAREIGHDRTLWLHGIYDEVDDTYTDYWRAYATYPRMRKDGVVAIAQIESGWRLFNSRCWRGSRDGVLNEDFTTATDFPTHAEAVSAGLSAIDTHLAWGVTGQPTRYGWTLRPEHAACSTCAGDHTRVNNSAQLVTTLVSEHIGETTVTVTEDSNWAPAIVEMRVATGTKTDTYATHDADIALAMAQALLDQAGEAA